MNVFKLDVNPNQIQHVHTSFSISSLLAELKCTGICFTILPITLHYLCWILKPLIDPNIYYYNK